MANKSWRIVSVDIGGTKIASALLSFDGSNKPCLEAYAKIPTEAERGGAVVLHNVIASVKRVIDAVGGTLDGIGISSAGVIDPASGDVVYANDLMPGWGGTHLGAELSSTFSLPTKVMNDVHAHALGEQRWGAGRGKSSCLVVAIGTGIGGAYILGNHILLGAHNEAGHIGHVSCGDAEGETCSCGATGHLEPIAAGPGIIQRFCDLGGAHSIPADTPIDGALIDKLAEAGNPAAIAAEVRSGHALGEVLGSMCNVFDPECIILSGSVAQCGDVWHDALSRGWKDSVMPPVSTTPILDGALGPDAPLIGAAENIIASGYANL